MKAFILSAVLFCIAVKVTGQVSGKLVTAGGQPVAFATILLLKATDTIAVATTFSKEDGTFTINTANQGRYMLQVSAVGYQDWHSTTFEMGAVSKDFGAIVMAEGNRKLKDVVLRSERPLYQRQQGGIAVNVGNSLLTKGSSALEVLERMPGVMIDRQRSNILLNGKSGVTVMLNGKLMRMSIDQLVALLNGMSGDDIARIELVSTPPAKYDAEGSGGVINIVLKKNTRQGTTGSYSLTGGWGWREKATAALTLGYNTKKVSLYGSYTYTHNNLVTDMFINSSQNMPYMGGPLNVILWDTTTAIQNNHNATLGIDVNVNNKTKVGASVTFNRSSSSSYNVNHSTYTVFPDSVLVYNGQITGINRFTNMVSSIYAEKDMGKGEKLYVGLDYLLFTNNNPSSIQSSFFNSKGDSASTGNNLYSPMQRSFANTTIQVGVLQADYTKQFTDKIKLEAGIKGAYTRNASTSGIERLLNGTWQGSSETSNNINMQEGIAAAYASFSLPLNKTINMVAGARYEYSYMSSGEPKNGGDAIERKLGKLFPNVFVTKKLNDESDLQLSYTQRIARPSYNDLASYVGYSDPTAVYTGNPLLKPTVTTNLRLQYNYKEYAISLVASRDNNPIARYQITESPSGNLLYVSPQNLVYQNNLFMEANLPFKINNWWSMSYSPSGGLRQFKETYSKQPVEKTYLAYMFSFSQTIRLPADLSVEVSGFAYSRSFNGSIKSNGGSQINAGIKKLLKKGGALQLSVNDLLMNAHYVNHYGTLTREAFDITNFVDFKTESRRFPIIKLSFTKSFGGDNGKSKRKTDNSSKEERDRIMAQ